MLCENCKHLSYCCIKGECLYVKCNKWLFTIEMDIGSPFCCGDFKPNKKHKKHLKELNKLKK